MECIESNYLGKFPKDLDSGIERYTCIDTPA